MEEPDTPVRFNFTKNLTLILLFFTLTPLALFASVLSLFSINSMNDIADSQAQTDTTPAGVKLYASLPPNNSTVEITITEGDSRPILLENFLLLNHSPLADFSKLLVDTADKYGLDWRLLPAIAMKESGACKAIPEGSHNCWGWGIHSQGTLMFSSYPEAIQTVALGLKTNYIDRGYVTPEEIMVKYAHPDSTTWADGIKYYMERLN